ncbi:tRNA-splicing endonuclease subunit alpha [Pyrococcus sp. NA2]|uniref:tRNA-intron lyase n=1 Tax=Pyrococcus sp. (strain NA2) TaxID=342949 RepID=UPI000209B058|nr:tRNA-intron lyase [Pyrococcus sp. NA2]AEC51826.1 tRNA-splicing endonuclease subunit alpha [Pyrococcus sp. NA2]
MKKVIEFYLSGDRVYSTREKAINQLYNNRGYGELKGNKLFLSLIEAAYLTERGWIQVLDGNRELSFEDIVNIGRKKDEDFDIKYIVYKDLRDRGYIVKSALKFGSHFRVYRKGAEHSDWLIWVLRESEKLRPNDITARVRVAHGVRKNMIMAIVDEDNDVVYYKVEWVKF